MSMESGERFRAARAEQRATAQVERVEIEAELAALRLEGIRAGSLEERRARWLTVRLSRIDEIVAAEVGP